MMSTRHPPLNDAQLRTLRWIADGCPYGVMTDFMYKVAALALQRRWLARVDRRKGR